MNITISESSGGLRLRTDQGETYFLFGTPMGGFDLKEPGFYGRTLGHFRSNDRRAALRWAEKELTRLLSSKSVPGGKAGRFLQALQVGDLSIDDLKANNRAQSDGEFDRGEMRSLLNRLGVVIQGTVAAQRKIKKAGLDFVVTYRDMQALEKDVRRLLGDDAGLSVAVRYAKQNVLRDLNGLDSQLLETKRALEKVERAMERAERGNG